MVIFLIILLLFFIYLIGKKYHTIYTLKIKKYWLSFGILCMMIAIVVQSKDAIQISQNSIGLWASSVLPSLFCFLICLEVIKQTSLLSIISRLLSPIMKPLFGVPGSGGLALLMGMTSGYPMGAKVTADLYEKGLCSKEEAEKILAFTNNSGPLFIIGAVGSGMFYDEAIGLKLYLAHIIAGITVGILLKKYHSSLQTSGIISQVSIKSNPSLEIHLSNIGKCMKIAIQNSIFTLLLILGFMVFFSVLGNLLAIIGLKALFLKLITPVLNMVSLSENIGSSLFYGIIEITGGLKELCSQIRIPLLQKECIASLLLGFGGLSVHMQVLSIVSETKLSIKPYLVGKLLHALLSVVYTLILFR